MSVKQLTAVAAQSERLLTEQQISAAGPGTILTDVQKLIEFIGAGGLRTGSNQGNLPSAALPELNRRLSHPLDLPLNRALLKHYPNIAGPYLLLRVMNLVQAEQDRLALDETALAAWSVLNPTEQYFALLEAWLILAEDSVLGGSQRRGRDPFTANLRFLVRDLSARWKTFDEFWHLYEFRGGLSPWNVQLHLRFGLIEAQSWPLEGRTGTARGWLLHRARHTPWGEAVAWALVTFLEVQNDDDLWDREPPAEAGFGFLQPAFQRYFPEWQRVYQPAKAAPAKGLYVFKVGFDPRWGNRSVWFRLRVPSSVSLDELAYAILKAFEFSDTDHLYEFCYRDQLGKSRCYNHPYCDEGPYASEVTLSESGLGEKQTMKFHFDFGDDWRFLVRLERIEPPNDKITKPTVIESHGQPPPQYPDWEEP